jgi:hypothetical protein
LGSFSGFAAAGETDCLFVADAQDSNRLSAHEKFSRFWSWLVYKATAIRTNRKPNRRMRFRIFPAFIAACPFGL